MSHEQLFSYVGDHLAAACHVLELLDYLQDHSGDAEIRSAAADFSAEVEADREVLEYLARELRVGLPSARVVAHWRRPRRTLPQIARTGEGPLPQLTALERVALGVLGRVALWDFLIAMTARDPSLPRLDYRGLRARARDLHRRVESHRLRFAMQSLPATPV